MSTPPPRLLDQVSQIMRVKHYSPRTQETYLAWIKRFILFHHKRHPKEMNTAMLKYYIKMTWNRVMVGLACLTRWPVNIPMLTGNGPGNTFSRQPR